MRSKHAITLEHLRMGALKGVILDATLGQKILDVTERQRESGVEPDRMSDDLGRKAMTLE